LEKDSFLNMFFSSQFHIMKVFKISSVRLSGGLSSVVVSFVINEFEFIAIIILKANNLISAFLV